MAVNQKLKGLVIGFGGTIAAVRLAASGKAVLLLERGTWADQHFPCHPEFQRTLRQD